MVPEPGAPVVVHSTTLLDAAGPVDDGWLSASDGLITDRGRGDGWRQWATDGTVADGSRRMLLPGFVDLHVHGGGGYSHEEGPEAVLAATAAHRRHGTTRSVISFVSDTVDVLAERLSSVADLMDEHPEVLGSHLEGPFLAESRRGAHNAARL